MYCMSIQDHHCICSHGLNLQGHYSLSKLLCRDSQLLFIFTVYVCVGWFPREEPHLHKINLWIRVTIRPLCYCFYHNMIGIFVCVFSVHKHFSHYLFGRVYIFKLVVTFCEMLFFLNGPLYCLICLLSCRFFKKQC